MCRHLTSQQQGEGWRAFIELLPGIGIRALGGAGVAMAALAIVAAFAMTADAARCYTVAPNGVKIPLPDNRCAKASDLKVDAPGLAPSNLPNLGEFIFPESQKVKPVERVKPIAPAKPVR